MITSAFDENIVSGNTSCNICTPESGQLVLYASGTSVLIFK